MNVTQILTSPLYQELVQGRGVSGVSQTHEGKLYLGINQLGGLFLFVWDGKVLTCHRLVGTRFNNRTPLFQMVKMCATIPGILSEKTVFQTAPLVEKESKKKDPPPAEEGGK